MDGGRQAGKAGLASRAQALDLAAEDVDPHPQRHGGRSPLVPAGPDVLAGCLVPLEEALVELSPALDVLLAADVLVVVGLCRLHT